MALTYLYPTGKPAFNRPYVRGFVGSVNVSDMALVGNELRFSYLAPTYFVVQTIFPNVYEPSSNFYTLDYVFDPDNSQVYQSGSPIVASAGLTLRYMPGEGVWRIQVLSTLAVDYSVTCDWINLAGHWWPHG